MNDIKINEDELKRFDDYRSENLVLLVGTNPLPNYVACHLLSKPSSHIFFVCTKATNKIADNLINVLKIGEDKWTKIQVDESNSNNIYSKISNQLEGKQLIGLNYTGGTKAMAVHTYRAVEAVAPDSVFSYLDARSLELVIDKKDCLSKRVHTNTSVKPKLEELFKLHGYSVNYKEHIFMPEMCKILGNNLFQDFSEWCEKKLRSDSSKLRSNQELKNVILPVNSPFEDLVIFWDGCSTLGQLTEKWKKENKWRKKVNDLAKWLEGKWLEDYTLLSFQKISDECDIHDSILGAQFNNNKFELDVAVLKGYELFVTSCTTTNKKGLIKQKLFEAYVRGQQLGGDEAKIGVVCFASEESSDASPEIILKEIEKEWHLENKFQVFGAEHIPDLSTHLKEWLNSK
ncbi:hypothetical protein [Methanosarcina sp. WWM596]|uniref:hypothetical protein n=1 Tax=Methanosarcina sp. WWM596 TaxID=1434103 RepID=UPI000615E0F6|nr:hypothetical protein [Methanosarcina sp. WWM596]AKB19475.1 hypothetical protein MSWHS_2612 [Methanosarcina sp. WWM596]